jgi:hypothetical protein
VSQGLIRHFRPELERRMKEFEEKQKKLNKKSIAESAQ